MKLDQKSSDLAAGTLEYLASLQGRLSLLEAATVSKKTVEPFRKARIVAPERLNHRFTV